MNYNQAHSTFPVDETSLAYMYSVSIFLTNVQTTYIAELLQSRHFQLGTAIPRSLGGIIRHSVSLLLIRITFYSGNLFSRIVTLGNGVERVCFRVQLNPFSILYNLTICTSCFLILRPYKPPFRNSSNLTGSWTLYWVNKSIKFTERERYREIDR